MMLEIYDVNENRFFGGIINEINFKKWLVNSSTK